MLHQLVEVLGVDGICDIRDEGAHDRPIRCVGGHRLDVDLGLGRHPVPSCHHIAVGAAQLRPTHVREPRRCRDLVGDVAARDGPDVVEDDLRLGQRGQ